MIVFSIFNWAEDGRIFEYVSWFLMIWLRGVSRCGAIGLTGTERGAAGHIRRGPFAVKSRPCSFSNKASLRIWALCMIRILSLLVTPDYKAYWLTHRSLEFLKLLEKHFFISFVSLRLVQAGLRMNGGGYMLIIFIPPELLIQRRIISWAHWQRRLLHLL